MRQDFITGRRVIMAPERAMRPKHSSESTTDSSLCKRDEDCPFCPGNEAQTPPEVIAIPKQRSDTEGWLVRVIPNKYPAVDPTYGIHELLIENPCHTRHPGKMSREELSLVIEACLSRCRNISNDTRLLSVLIFRNHGEKAGASIEHPHSQIMALPLIYPELACEIEGAQRYYYEKKNCPYCDLIAAEKNSERLVLENKAFIVFVPYAARFPFEVWILPKKHRCSFLDVNEEEQYWLAHTLKAFLAKISERLNEPAYNYYFHTAPFRYKHMPGYHWHIEFIPRFATIAGFELGSGIYINTITPEYAADYLKH